MKERTFCKDFEATSVFTEFDKNVRWNKRSESENFDET